MGGRSNEGTPASGNSWLEELRTLPPPFLYAKINPFDSTFKQRSTKPRVKRLAVTFEAEPWCNMNTPPDRKQGKGGYDVMAR